VETPGAANEARGEVKGKIGDREFVLVPSFENIANMESTLKRSFIQISNEFRQERPSFTMEEVARMIYIAQSEPKLSYNGLGKLLVKHGTLSGLAMLGKFIGVALSGQESLKEDEGNEGAKGTP
jgi:hypothetical protein